MSDQSPPTLKEIWHLFKETDAKFKETSAELKKAGRLISANAEHLGRLSKKWGDLGEAMTIGETLPLFNTIAGIEVHSLHTDIISQHKGKEWEIDAIAIGKQIYGAVGFLSAHSDATELALASGLLLIHPNRDDKKVITPPPDLKLRNFHP